MARKTFDCDGHELAVGMYVQLVNRNGMGALTSVHAAILLGKPQQITQIAFQHLLEFASCQHGYWEASRFRIVAAPTRPGLAALITRYRQEPP